ncbi:DHH family phosphoesterase [bacterium]|nr:DHH family phosphoesterase [bacterium]
MKKNYQEVVDFLELGVEIFYADHHQSGDLLNHKNFRAHINESSNICTSLIINKYLSGKYQEWAIVGAYGDGMDKSARIIANKADLSKDDRAQLRLLGICINYNSYGENEMDLLYHPSLLYKLLKHNYNPFDFISNESGVYNKLLDSYYSDISKAKAISPEIESDNVSIIFLPDESWSRRVVGVYANLLMQSNKNRAHALMVINKDKSYLVGVRAPYNNKIGADILCSIFGGGGRRGAAGINNLPKQDKNNFIQEFKKQFSANKVVSEFRY